MAAWETTRAVFFRHSVSIAGRVLDGYTQEPIAGAPVVLTAPKGSRLPKRFVLRREALKANDPCWEQRIERPDRTISRADGSYCFLDLPAGTYQLEARSPFPGTWYKTPSEPRSATVAAGQATNRACLEADLALWPTRITGAVTRKDTGAPVAGARVRIVGTRHEALTGKDGKYTLVAVEASRCTLEASARFYIPDKVEDTFEDFEVRVVINKQLLAELRAGDGPEVNFSLALD